MPVKTMFSTALHLVVSKHQADSVYSNLLPALRHVIRETGRNSQESSGLIAILENLPSFGVQRHNFKKLYINDTNGWKKLPDNPNDIPYGHWH